MEEERQTVIDTLTQCYSRGYLDEEEFERRVDRSYQATAVNQLKPLIADLPDRYSAALTTMGASLDPDEGLQVVSVLSSRKMEGDWLEQRVAKCVGVLGDVKLDLREVDLLPGRTRIHLFGLMADFTVILPSDVKLKMSTTSILSDVSTKKARGRLADGATKEIHFTGTLIMSDFKVKVVDER